MKNVLITSQDDSFGKSLAAIFVREGYNVFTPGVNEADESLDIYIDISDERNAADTFTIRDGLDEDVIRAVYEKNVLGSMALLEKHLPLLDAGAGKRLCFLTAAEASINTTLDTCGFAYKLSKTAMHNFYQMTANKLVPDGYTFRIFDTMHGEIDVNAAAEGAFHYFTRKRGTEHNDPQRNDENRLVFRDALGREHTW